MRGVISDKSMGKGINCVFFPRKMRSVTSVVFVETADYAIAVAGYEAVQFSFRTVEPFGYETVVGRDSFGLPSRC